MLFQGLDKNIPVATSIKPSRKINVKRVNDQSTNQLSSSVNLRYKDPNKQYGEAANPLTQTQQSKHSRGNTASSSTKIMNIQINGTLRRNKTTSKRNINMLAKSDAYTRNSSNKVTKSGQDFLEHQLREMMRRRLEDEVCKLDIQSSYLEVDKSDAMIELG